MILHPDLNAQFPTLFYIYFFISTEFKLSGYFYIEATIGNDKFFDRKIKEKSFMLAQTKANNRFLNVPFYMKGHLKIRRRSFYTN